MANATPGPLANLAAQRRVTQSVRSPAGAVTYDTNAFRDANDTDLAALGIHVAGKASRKDAGYVEELTACPFSQDHDDGAYRAQKNSGYIDVRCHHERCTGKSLKSEPDLFPHSNAIRPLGSGTTRLMHGAGVSANREEETGVAREQRAPIYLKTRKASDIESREIEWIWKPWLPGGMVTLFAGYGGSGKSTVALDIAAAGSVKGTLPDGQPSPPFNTLIFAAEDSPEYTIIPRLKLLGADMSRVHIVDGVAQDGDTDPVWVRFQNHMPVIEAAIRDLGIGLVIIDPISSYVGNANGDRESDVRSGLMPAVLMAERTGAAVLLIRHVSKTGDGTRAASRILGSTAWHDVPRMAWMLADAPDDHQPPTREEDGLRDTRRVLGVVKSNIAAKPPALWCVQPVDGPLRWLSDTSPVTIDECFFSQSNSKNDSSLERAEEWLIDYLKGGMQLSDDAWKARKEAGIGEKAFKKARQSLGIETQRMQDRWYMSLPISTASHYQGRKEGQGGQSGSTVHIAPLASEECPSIQNSLFEQGVHQTSFAPVAPLAPAGNDAESLPPNGTGGFNGWEEEV